MYLIATNSVTLSGYSVTLSAAEGSFPFQILRQAQNDKKPATLIDYPVTLSACSVTLSGYSVTLSAAEGSFPFQILRQAQNDKKPATLIDYPVTLSACSVTLSGYSVTLSAAEGSSPFRFFGKLRMTDKHLAPPYDALFGICLPVASIV